MPLDQYRKMLHVNKNRLDDELEMQSDFMMRISSQVVALNSSFLEQKDLLAQLEGRIAEDVKEGDLKLSLSAIDAKVKRDANRIKSWQKLQACRAELEEWQGLLDAWKQKGYSIKTLSDLYAAQYFSVDSTRVSERQQKRDEEGDQRRGAMRRASSQSTTSTRRRVEE